MPVLYAKFTGLSRQASGGSRTVGMDEQPAKPNTTQAWVNASIRWSSEAKTGIKCKDYWNLYIQLSWESRQHCLHVFESTTTAHVQMCSWSEYICPAETDFSSLFLLQIAGVFKSLLSNHSP